MRTTFCGLILLGVTACAQTSMSVPDLGIVYDPAVKGLRPIWGVAGSAFLGAPIELGFDVIKAAVAQRQNPMLAATADAVYVVRLSSSGVSSLPVPGWPGMPDLLRSNASGNTAAAYYTDSRTLFIARALDAESPGVTTVPLERAPSSVAISDDGRLLVAISPREDESVESLLIETESGSVRVLDGFVRPTAAVFLSGAHDLVVADPGSDAVLLIRDVAAGGERSVLTSAGGESARPQSIQVSPDNRQLLFADTVNRSVTVFNIETGERRSIASRFKPSAVQPLWLAGLYLLTDVSGGIAWMLDSTRAEPRILFIPPEIAYYSSSSETNAE